jgi:crotonobetainyl-CoA:carnitine CoA-transferase CaiB-like acyl-CoA transferase
VTSMPDPFLHDCLVVELGDRLAVGACGSLLAQLGATVVLVEDDRPRPPATKWPFRPLIAAGKKSLKIGDSAADRDLLARLVARSDVLLDSTDMRPRPYAFPEAADDRPLLCDITAFGSSGPLAGHPYSDALLQATTGALHSTGSPERDPTLARFPLMEFTASIYATAAVLAGLRARRDQGISQTVEVALYDVGISMLASFLPSHFVGGKPQRIGNHHPSMSPWNLYRTSNGWVLICAGSDDQWCRICEMFRHPELGTDPRFATPTLRVKNHVEIDQIVEQWTRHLSVADCVERFNSIAIACGPVYSVAELFADPGLMRRGMFCESLDPDANRPVRIPGSLFLGLTCQGRVPTSIPPADSDRTFIESLIGERRSAGNTAITEPPKAPLAGIRVVEIGNYTTAPLVGRQLGAMGAYVVKVEAPTGDLGRPLPPVRDGQGYFFTLGNSDKRTLTVDLRSVAGKALLRKLLSEADILVENLKVGSFARLGFDDAEITRINPRLVHCAVTGFGNDSPYADRAAMDTTIQGMSGIMALTQGDDGIPYKTGISTADLAGGQLGLVAVLAGLAYRDRTGRGQHIEVSMQAAGAWLTQTAWNPGVSDPWRVRLFRCADGWVAAESAWDFTGAPPGTDRIEAVTAVALKKTRRQMVELLSQQGIACAPVSSISEAAQHPQTVSRNLISTGVTAAGVQWPLLACPMRFSKTPTTVRRAISPAGLDFDEVMTDWNLSGDISRAREATSLA